jgi:hypothetical protein
MGRTLTPVQTRLILVPHSKPAEAVYIETIYSISSK